MTFPVVTPPSAGV